jgi:hypothetical protein
VMNVKHDEDETVTRNVNGVIKILPKSNDLEAIVTVLCLRSHPALSVLLHLLSR